MSNVIINKSLAEKEILLGKRGSSDDALHKMEEL